MLMGLMNGAIRVHELETPFDVGSLGPYWMLTIHDNNYGKVMELSLSFDGRVILTVGADGNFFTFNFMEQEKIDEKVAEAKAKIPSARVSRL